MKPFKKVFLSVLGVLPIPSLAFSALHQNLSKDVEVEVAEKSFAQAIDREILPESFYLEMEEQGLSGVHELFYDENSDLYLELLTKWKTKIDEEIQLAQSTTSELPTEGLYER